MFENLIKDIDEEAKKDKDETTTTTSEPSVTKAKTE